MANDLNCVALVGRLVRDMETKFTSGGMAVGKFSVAIGERVKKGESWEDYTSFLDCTCFGKTAEDIAQYMAKGKQVAITGEIHQDRWQKDGETKSRVVINCNTIQLLGGKSESRDEAPPASVPPRVAAASAPDGFEDDIPPEIPF